MSSVISALQNIVPFASFNNGEAEKIFDEVKKYGAKVVIKNDTAECVLLSPQEYLALIEELEDAQLVAIAEERLRNSKSKLFTAEEVCKELGLSEKDLEEMCNLITDSIRLIRAIKNSDEEKYTKQ